MSNSETMIEVASYGKIYPKKQLCTRSLYEHQSQALKCLDKMDELSSYRTLVILPTGGGKTYTASTWLLKHAINRGKKVLWIAHRKMLLDQAVESFRDHAYSEIIPRIDSFSFRIISGSSKHDRVIHIEPTDNLIIASKDSIGRNIHALDAWLQGEDEVYLIIDEAHHSTAKTYRKVIDHLNEKVPNLKLIGLTATPFRTATEEQGLLAKIYSDGIKEDEVVHGDVGICYQIGLKELISRQILAAPKFEQYFTEEKFGETLGLNALESIQHLDILPIELATQLSKSAARNRFIVDTYFKKSKEYEQTIIFAIDVDHAVWLSTLFNQKGIPTDYVVSSVKDSITGVSNTQEDNNQIIEKYKRKELQVLINVDILTEGVDLPSTKTVFLTRPTVSTIRMTQMIGRALRGLAAGGTKDAFIVSFIDNWNERIAWVNPETLFKGNNEFKDTPLEKREWIMHYIAIAKLEEFALLLDSTIDSSKIESVPFIERLPIGMYAFQYLEENGADITYQVMVYNSTVDAYQMMMKELPQLFKNFQSDEEYINHDLLIEMENACRETYFTGEMTPPYESKDVHYILKYFAQYGVQPTFYTFDEIDRNKLDLAVIARFIWDNNMGGRIKKEYIDSLWVKGDDNILRMLFRDITYLSRLIDVESSKIDYPYLFKKEDNVKYGERSLEDFPLYEIGKTAPDVEKKLRDAAFEKSLNEKREYQCACCGYSDYSRIYFQVDHIISMNRGGKSIPENLQILCRTCNGTKGDK